MASQRGSPAVNSRASAAADGLTCQARIRSRTSSLVAVSAAAGARDLAANPDQRRPSRQIGQHPAIALGAERRWPAREPGSLQMAEELGPGRRPAAHAPEHLFTALGGSGRHPAATEPLFRHLAGIALAGQARGRRNT
jgi:hypothetical protein